jgi:hypothetical protein
MRAAAELQVAAVPLEEVRVPVAVQVSAAARAEPLAAALSAAQGRMQE